MRLSATTTTKRRIKSNAKQTLQAPTATAASPAEAAAATTLATTTRTTGTRETAATRQIECFICNLIQLFLLTTTAAICTVSALGMAHAHAHALAPAEPAQPDEPQTNRAVMDAFSGQRFDQLPSDFASSQMLAASVVDVETAAAATTSAAFQFTTTHPHAHTHSHGHTTPTTTTATTLRVSYGKCQRTLPQLCGYSSSSDRRMPNVIGQPATPSCATCALELTRPAAREIDREKERACKKEVEWQSERALCQLKAKLLSTLSLTLSANSF